MGAVKIPIVLIILKLRNYLTFWNIAETGRDLLLIALRKKHSRIYNYDSCKKYYVLSH